MEEIVKLLPHNIETYAQVKSTLLEKHQVALVQATGTGKSFIMLRLIEELFQGKRVLYVVPYLRIGENFKKYKEFAKLNMHFDVVTYNSFGSVATPRTADYDAVLIDEFHHMGSAIYGRALWEFKDKMVGEGKHVVAVTATPVRPLDAYRDMGDEAFSDCVVSGISAEEAIRLGILRKPIYALAIHEGLDEEYNSDGHVDFQSGVEEIRRVIEEYCDYNGVRRWLVYVASLQTMQDVEQTIKAVLPGVKIFSISSRKRKLKNEQIIESFINSKEEAVLISANMLLEGTHLPVPVAGIMNFRHIVSSNVFWQMMGRLYDANAKHTPLFINIAGYKFYKPRLGSTGFNLNSWMNTEDRDCILHDVTSIEVIEHIQEYFSDTRKRAFSIDGVFYYNLADWYNRNKTENSVGYSRFSANVTGGMSLNDALQFAGVASGIPVAVTYNGVTYDSIAAMCRATGISKSVVETARVQAGDDQTKFDELVTGAVTRLKRHKDNLRGYATLADFYNGQSDLAAVDVSVFKTRYTNGWDIMAALTTPCSDMSVSIDGVSYPNKKSAAKALGLSTGMIWQWEKQYGWDTQEFRDAIKSAQEYKKKHAPWPYKKWFEEHGKDSKVPYRTWRNRVQYAGNPKDDETLYSLMSEPRKIPSVSATSDEVELSDGRKFSSLKEYWETIPVDERVSFSYAATSFCNGCTPEESVRRARPKQEPLAYMGEEFDSYVSLVAFIETEFKIKISAQTLSTWHKKHNNDLESAILELREKYSAVKEGFVYDEVKYDNLREFYEKHKAEDSCLYSSFQRKVKQGVDPMKALKPVNPYEFEYLGETYEDHKDFYNKHVGLAVVEFNTFDVRTRKWKEKDGSVDYFRCLTTPLEDHSVMYKDVKYGSLHAVWEAHRDSCPVTEFGFITRVRGGMSIEEALTKPAKGS